MNGGVVTIFGEDGQGFGQSDASELVFRETGPYDQVVLNLGISVQALEEESQ
jgi:hypothetical protein